MNNSKYNYDCDNVDFDRVANDIMFTLINRDEPFSADNFYPEARKFDMPPELIKEFSGSMFRQFQAAGYINKTDKFVLSKRNGSTPLPLWIGASENETE